MWFDYKLLHLLKKSIESSEARPYAFGGYGEESTDSGCGVEVADCQVPSALGMVAAAGKLVNVSSNDQLRSQIAAARLSICDCPSFIYQVAKLTTTFFNHLMISHEKAYTVDRHPSLQHQISHILVSISKAHITLN